MEREFYLVSSHGTALFYIAVNPGCTVYEMADELCLTRRTLWGLIGDLRREGMLIVRRDGKEHHYYVDMSAEFSNPVLGNVPLRTILGRLSVEARAIAARAAQPVAAA